MIAENPRKIGLCWSELLLKCCQETAKFKNIYQEDGRTRYQALSTIFVTSTDQFFRGWLKEGAAGHDEK